MMKTSNLTITSRQASIFGISNPPNVRGVRERAINLGTARSYLNAWPPDLYRLIEEMFPNSNNKSKTAKILNFLGVIEKVSLEDQARFRAMFTLPDDVTHENCLEHMKTSVQILEEDINDFISPKRIEKIEEVMGILTKAMEKLPPDQEKASHSTGFWMRCRISTELEVVRNQKQPPINRVDSFMRAQDCLKEAITKFAQLGLFTVQEMVAMVDPTECTESLEQQKSDIMSLIETITKRQDEIKHQGKIYNKKLSQSKEFVQNIEHFNQACRNAQQQGYHPSSTASAIEYKSLPQEEISVSPITVDIDSILKDTSSATSKADLLPLAAHYTSLKNFEKEQKKTLSMIEKHKKILMERHRVLKKLSAQLPDKHETPFFEIKSAKEQTALVAEEVTKLQEGKENAQEAILRVFSDSPSSSPTSSELSSRNSESKSSLSTPTRSESPSEIKLEYKAVKLILDEIIKNTTQRIDNAYSKNRFVNIFSGKRQAKRAAATAIKTQAESLNLLLQEDQGDKQIKEAIASLKTKVDDFQKTTHQSWCRLFCWNGTTTANENRYLQDTQNHLNEIESSLTVYSK